MSLPPHHANSSRTSFRNPWPPLQTVAQSALSILKIPLARAPRESVTTCIPDIRTVPFEVRQEAHDETAHNLSATWLGHAGWFIQFPNGRGAFTNVICDPLFAERASPLSWIGPKRRLPPPCLVQDLPEIHFVAISHNHYDHLDAEALKVIHKRWPSVQYLVPLGVKRLLVDIDLPSQRVHELDWWETFTDGDMRFVCTPAQHNSGRDLLDQRKTLWCSWVIERPSSAAEPESQPKMSVYFAGDTGYQTADGPCPTFKKIGSRHGPFDLALIPIWRGASLSFLGHAGLRFTDDDILATLHALPEDAVHIQQDVGARHAIGMHFATFASIDEAREPLVRLKQAVGELDWKREGGFGVVNVGEMAVIPAIDAH